jgi:hypothetical protein
MRVKDMSFLGSTGGLGMFPNFLKSPKIGGHRGLKRSAGYLLLGVWGCPPVLTSPKIGGYRGLKIVVKLY